MPGVQQMASLVTLMCPRLDSATGLAQTVLVEYHVVLH